MNNFLMFYAPFIVLIGSLVLAFVVAPKDDAVRRQIDEEE
ncbi:cytochrome bd oxidase small subunit CydS [Sporosarcina jiandibaonis]